ncbi:MAG: hypothetical protein LBV23_03810 [Deltaproteobacteria bacterium]|nr:hypothetical protein [Deltaproteobacteria bacterium]
MPSFPRKSAGAGPKNRLECLGRFDPNDKVCNHGCSLAINCALIRNERLDVQVIEGDRRCKSAQSLLWR